MTDPLGGFWGHGATRLRLELAQHEFRKHNVADEPLATFVHRVRTHLRAWMALSTSPHGPDAKRAREIYYRLQDEIVSLARVKMRQPDLELGDVDLEQYVSRVTQQLNARE